MPPRRHQHPTRPDFPHEPDPATTTEGSTLQKELYSRALFLEFAEKTQGVKRHYSSGFWFNEETRKVRRNHHDLGSAIKTFLDGMAMFLCQPGVEGVTACAMEVCVDETAAVPVRARRTEIVGASRIETMGARQTEAIEGRQTEIVDAGQTEAMAERQTGTVETRQAEAVEEGQTAARGTDTVASGSGSRKGKMRKGKMRPMTVDEDYNQLGSYSATYLTAPQLNASKPHPNQQVAYTVTLRISRNEDVPKETVDFAKKLLRWIRTADVTDAACDDLFTTIASTCRLDIQSKLGEQPDNAKIRLMKRGCDILAGCDCPPFEESLRNLRVMDEMTDFVYTPRYHSQAFDTFVKALRIYIALLESILESKDNAQNIVDAVACAYKFRKDRVIAHFLSASLDETERDGIVTNFEKLGSYHSNILHFITIANQGPQHHLGWVFHSTTKVCVTAARKSHIVATKLNDLASATLKDGEVVSRLSLPPPIQGEYRKHESANIIEHCEMQLVRFYIENPTVFPVVPYLGASKLSCYCCDQFLKNLQHPEDIGYPGPAIEFSVRGTHGKIYSLWRPPVDMQTDNHVLERVNGAIKDLVTDLDTLCKRKLQSYVKPRKVLADGPDWSSSDEDDEPKKLRTGKGFAWMRNALLE